MTLALARVKIKHEHIIITKTNTFNMRPVFSLMQERLSATSQVRLVPKTASASFTLACLYIESSLYEQVLQYLQYFILLLVFTL